LLLLVRASAWGRGRFRYKSHPGWKRARTPCSRQHQQSSSAELALNPALERKGLCILVDDA
jgi:hypothetical protein